MPAEDPVDPFGATIQDVRNLLPLRTISPVSKPNDQAVHDLLVTTSDWVASRIGELAAPLDPDVIVAVQGAAKGVAAMGAAALTENATFPERAGVAGSSYGDWLWIQYLRGIDELLETLQKPTEDTGGPGEAPAGDVPAFATPDPLFSRDVGF